MILVEMFMRLFGSVVQIIVQTLSTIVIEIIRTLLHIITQEIGRRGQRPRPNHLPGLTPQHEPAWKRVLRAFFR